MCAFRLGDLKLVLREVEDLRVLGLVRVEQFGPASFRVTITPKGKAEPNHIWRRSG